MALNRYSKLPTANIRSSQALTDLGIIDTALQRQQQNYNTTAATGSAFQSAVSKLQGYGDYAKNYIGMIDADVNAKLGELSTKNLGDPKVAAELNGYISNIQGDKKLQEIQNVAALRSKYDESAADLAAKGKLSKSQKNILDRRWDLYSKTGQISPELQMPLFEAADLVTERGKLFSMIKSSGSEGAAMLGDIAYKVGQKGVSLSSINNAAAEQLLTYKNSHAGQQEKMDYQDLVESGAIDPKKLSFDAYLLEQVLSTGRRYAHSETSTDIAGAINKGRDEKLAKEKEIYDGEGHLPAMAVGKDVQVDSEGRIDQPWYSDVYDYFSGGDSRSAEQLETERTARAAYDRAKKTGFNGSFKDYAQTVLNTDANVHVRYFTKKRSDELSEQFFNGTTKGGTSMNERVYDPESKQWMSFNDLIKEYDISREDLKGVSITGEISPDNELGIPKGQQLVVGDKSFIIDKSRERSKNPLEDVARDFQHKAAQAKYNPSNETTFEAIEPTDGKKYEFTYIWDGNELKQTSKRLAKNQG